MGYVLVHCLVTGARGFLGKKLWKALQATGMSVTATSRQSEGKIVGCPLLEADAFRTLVKRKKPACIVHCAAEVPKNSGEYESHASNVANLKMFQTVLHASLCPVVFISSMTVYPSGLLRPAREEDADLSTAKTEYARGKLQAETLLKEDGRPGLAVRIPGLFGISRREGLVYNLLKSSKTGKIPSLPTNPIMWAGMDVDDAAQSIIRLIQTGISSFETINIGYRQPISVNRLVSIVEELTQTRILHEVIHPDFEMDLQRAEQRDAIPEKNLFQAVEKNLHGF